LEVAWAVAPLGAAHTGAAVAGGSRPRKIGPKTVYGRQRGSLPAVLYISGSGV
jgi:hypothetical protein